MTQTEEITSLKARVAELESSMAEVVTLLGIGRVDDAALQDAMAALLDGDNTALDRFIKRGGKIPRGIAA